MPKMRTMAARLGKIAAPADLAVEALLGVVDEIWLVGYWELRERGDIGRGPVEELGGGLEATQELLMRALQLGGDLRGRGL